MKRPVTMSLWRAMYFSAAKFNLEDELRKALSKESVEKYQYDLAGEQTALTKWEERDGGLALHVSTYVPRDKAGLIHTETFETAEASAPEGNEFVSGEIFAFVAANTLAIVGIKKREGRLRAFLADILISHGNKDAATFDLSRVTDADQLNWLAGRRVRMIDLRANAFDPTIWKAQEDHGRDTNFWKGIAQSVSALALEDPPDTVPGGEHLSVSVVMKVDRKGRGGLAGEALQEIGKAAIDEKFDDFIIHLDDGTQLRSDQLVLKQAVQLPRFGNSVSRVAAWEALAMFYRRVAADIEDVE